MYLITEIIFGVKRKPTFLRLRYFCYDQNSELKISLGAKTKAEAFRKETFSLWLQIDKSFSRPVLTLCVFEPSSLYSGKIPIQEIVTIK